MIQKIKQWWARRKNITSPIPPEPVRELTQDEMAAGLYNYDQLQDAYRLGYNDGKVEGLSIARVQATKSLKEILWQQNQSKK